MSSPGIRLIVGLANPGKEYEATRHNAGAWWVEKLADLAQLTLKHEVKFHGLYGVSRLHHTNCHLLIPTTFMNRSGLAVRALMQYHKLSPEQVLIAHDEIDLPVGTIKLKLDGGDGGHNGLKDIIQHLNTRQFYRLRIGVDRPNHAKDVADYVLHPPSIADRQTIDSCLDAATDVLPLLLKGEIAKAMQTLHS